MKYLKNHRVKSFLTGLFSAVVVLLCFAGSVPAAQVDAVWDGGGGTNYWNTATNWNPNVIPNNGTNTYNVFIGGLYLPDYTVYLNTSPTIDNLTIDTSDSFTVINNSHLYIAGGASAGTITNNGSILLNGSSTYTDLILNSGDVLLTGAGTLTMSNYANNRIFGSSSTYRLTNSAGHTIQGSGLLGNNQMALTNEGTITANQSNALTINPSSSGFTNNGTIRANSGSTLTVNDTLTNLSGTTLTGGTYYVTGTMRLPGAINTNAASIILDGTSSNLYNGTSGTNNALTNLNTNNGSFSILNDRDFTTAGNLTNSGAIIVGDNSILKINSTGTGMLTSSGSISGTGTINGDVVNSGSVMPGLSPGMLTVDGDYTQSETGNLFMEIAGLTPVSEYDVFNVTGNAYLAGALSVDLLNGFMPAMGNSFTILTANNIYGTFNAYNLPALGNGMGWDVAYNANNVSLMVTPEPMSAILFLSGASVFVIRRFRRAKH